MAKKQQAQPQEQVQVHRTKTTKETRMLRVALTAEELLAAGQKMADQMRLIEATEAEADRIKKQYQGKIAEAQATLEVARGLVQDKYEIRKVSCENVLDYTDVRCRVTRLDTNEIVENRRLSEDEKQTSLPFAVEGPVAEDEEPEEDEQS